MGYQVSIDLSKLIAHMHQTWERKHNTRPLKRANWKQAKENRAKENPSLCGTTDSIFGGRGSNVNKKKKDFPLAWRKKNNISMANSQEQPLFVISKYAISWH